MNESYVESQIYCQQCAAVLPVKTGSQFVTCEFCGTTNFVDKSQVVLHYVVRSTIEQANAVSSLKRWLGGNDTVKNLDQKANIKHPTFSYFPMWLIRWEREGKESVIMEPAAAISISELKNIRIPAANLMPYDKSFASESVAPTIPYQVISQWLKDDHQIEKNEVRETSLVHIPVYIIKYNFKNRSYTAVVDAATGEVFANIFPSKWEAPYQIIAALAFIAYFLAALIPFFGYLGGFFGFAILLYLFLTVLFAVPIFIVALIISAKV